MKKIYSLLYIAFFLVSAYHAELNAQACGGAPGPNSIIGPTTVICPGPATLSLSTPYSVTGITFQWQQATLSNVGPFTAVPGATSAIYVTPALTSGTYYYNVVITCTNSTASITLAAVTISVAATTTSVAPYHEGFEGITANNQLPNCSWSASSLGNTCLTFTSGGSFSGSKYAAFYYLPSGQRNFYTNGIQLKAGVTYSAGIWFNNGFSGSTNWTDLSILVGPNQSPTGQVSIVSTNGPAIANVYTALSNTFTVPSNGLYYISIRGTCNGSGTSQYLVWDDLTVTIPCTQAFNTPTISLVASSPSVCSGQQVTVTATGADLYSWNGGSTTNTMVDTPVVPATYTYNVVGTSTLSGCIKLASITVTVGATPVVYVTTSNASVCLGSFVTLNAIGSTNYTWSNGQQGQGISVSPTINTTYTTTTANSNGCSASSTVQISVLPLPVISVLASPVGTICAGNEITLTAAGANSYQWASGSNSFAGTTLTLNPSAAMNFIVSGTDNNNCVGQLNYVLHVNACTGLIDRTFAESEIKIYPNPTNGILTLVTGDIDAQFISITDVTGKLIQAKPAGNGEMHINLEGFSAGIYYGKIESKTRTYNFKIVKQ